MKPLKKVIAVDFDGTIACSKDVFPNINNEIPNAIKVLKKLQKKGFIIILWTCRENKNLKIALDWLSKKNFNPDYVNNSYIEDIKFWNNDCRKIGYSVLIDDKSLGGIPSWNTIYRKIIKMYK